MQFFRDLISLPFVSSLLASPLTLVWILIILGVFLFALLRFELPIARRTWRIRRLVARCFGAQTTEDPRSRLVTIMSAESWIRRPFERFERTWRNSYRSNRDAALGDIELADFISPDEALPPTVNRHLARAVPQTLIALGIVGTFLGLVRALPDTSTTEATAEAMQELLDSITGGMNLAFSTSIVGISCSLIFLWVNRTLVRQLERRINQLSQVAADVFPTISSHEALHIQTELLEEAVNSIKTVGTDVSIALADAISPALDTALQAHLAPAVETIRGAVEKLIDVTANQGMEGLETIVTSFTASMNSALGEQFGELSRILESTVESQRSIQSGLAEFNQNLTTSAGAQTQLIEHTSRAARTLGGSLDRLERISASLGEAASKVAEAGLQLERSAKTASEAQAAATAAQKELLEASAEHSATMTKARSDLMEAWEGAVQQAEGAIHQIQQTTKELGEGIGEQLVSALQTFDGALAEMIQRFSGTLAETNASVGELPPAAREIRESAVGLREASTAMVASVTDLRDTVKGLVADNIRDAVDAAAALQGIATTATSAIESAGEIHRSIHESATVMSNALAEIGQVRAGFESLSPTLDELRGAVARLTEHTQGVEQSLNGTGPVGDFNRNVEHMAERIQGIATEMDRRLIVLSEAMNRMTVLRELPSRVSELTDSMRELRTSMDSKPSERGWFPFGKR